MRTTRMTAGRTGLQNPKEVSRDRRKGRNEKTYVFSDSRSCSSQSGQRRRLGSGYCECGPPRNRNRSERGGGCRRQSHHHEQGSRVEPNIDHERRRTLSVRAARGWLLFPQDRTRRICDSIRGPRRTSGRKNHNVRLRAETRTSIRNHRGYYGGPGRGHGENPGRL